MKKDKENRIGRRVKKTRSDTVQVPGITELDRKPAQNNRFLCDELNQCLVDKRSDLFLQRPVTRRHNLYLLKE